MESALRRRKDEGGSREETHPLSVTTGPAFILPILSVGFSQPIFCRSVDREVRQNLSYYFLEKERESECEEWRLTDENLRPRERRHLNRHSLLPVGSEDLRVLASVGNDNEVCRGFGEDLFPELAGSSTPANGEKGSVREGKKCRRGGRGYLMALSSS
jgi:hypothetical protein